MKYWSSDNKDVPLMHANFLQLQLVYIFLKKILGHTQIRGKVNWKLC